MISPRVYCSYVLPTIRMAIHLSSMAHGPSAYDPSKHTDSKHTKDTDTDTDLLL
jgi:hypothetical protein|eukprot:COSAG06_NODE_438_length_15766_cov_6.128997_5_plen_54_part_00